MSMTKLGRKLSRECGVASTAVIPGCARAARIPPLSFRGARSASPESHPHRHSGAMRSIEPGIHKPPLLDLNMTDAPSCPKRNFVVMDSPMRLAPHPDCFAIRPLPALRGEVTPAVVSSNMTGNGAPWLLPFSLSPPAGRGSG
jgi:hypothetical protein